MTTLSESRLNQSLLLNDMNPERSRKLRVMCRDYLMKLRHIAEKHGLYLWWRDTVDATMKDECEPSEKEVSMLSRLVDDERISRKDIPKVLGKSYRQCNEDGDFDKIKKLPHVGIYSKVNTLLHKKD